MVGRGDALRVVKTEKLGDPYVVAGDRAYLVGTQDGLFPDLGWHQNGEMGGLWAHPIKLLDGVWLRIDEAWLEQAREYGGGPFWSEHLYTLSDGLEVTRRAWIPDGTPGLLLRYTVRADDARTLRLRLLARSDLMGAWLADLGGIRDGYDHARYDDEHDAWIVRDDLNPWRVVAGAAGLKPIGHESGRELWGPQQTAGHGISVALDYELPVPANEETEFEVAIAGSDAGEASALSYYDSMRAAESALWDEKAARYERMLDRSRLDIPDASIMNAWDWLKCNNDWLVRDVPNWGRGLGAGIQDYPWWFGCDNGYALRGCLALGQHEIAVATLDLLRELSVAANGDSGRVIHECSTWGTPFNPGNTQEMPHFVRAVWDTFLWTGDLAFLRRNYPFCKRGLLEWTLGTQCPDGDVLPHGYGIIEVEGLNLRCVDTATLTVEALDALAGMATLLGEEGVAARCRLLHQEVRRRLDEAFWMDAEGLYGDMVAAPTEMAPRLRAWLDHAAQTNDSQLVEAYRALLDEAESDPEQERERPWLLKNWSGLCPLENGLAAPERAGRVLDRMGTDEFVGRWGLYVSALDKRHSMSISTGVLAVAEAAYGRVERALEHLRLLTDTLDLQMPGAIAEMSPDYGCFVQAWSSYGVAWALAVGIFGLRPDAPRRRLVLTPAFPAAWSSARLDNVRVGSNSFDLYWDGATLRVASREPGWTVLCETVPVQVVPAPG